MESPILASSYYSLWYKQSVKKVPLDFFKKRFWSEPEKDLPEVAIHKM